MRILQAILFLSLFLAVTSCNKDKDTSVYIRFVNETGNTIENAKVDSMMIGNIPAGSQSGYLSFADLYMYEKVYPIFLFSGNINGQPIKREYIHTDPRAPVKTKVPPGKYDVVIKPDLFTSPQTFWILFK